MEKESRIEFYDDNHNAVFSLTEKQLHQRINKLLEKIINASIAINENATSKEQLMSLKDVADLVMSQKIGRLKDRIILDFIMCNYKELGIPLNNTFCTEESYKRLQEVK